MSMFDFQCSKCKRCTFHCICDETGEWIPYPKDEPREPCESCDEEDEAHLH